MQLPGAAALPPNPGKATSLPQKNAAAFQLLPTSLEHQEKEFMANLNNAYIPFTHTGIFQAFISFNIVDWN